MSAYERLRDARRDPTGVAEQTDRIVGGLLGMVIRTELRDVDDKEDDLCWDIYHALLMSFLAYMPARLRAEGTAAGGGTGYTDRTIRQVLLRRAVSSFTKGEIAYQACSLSGSEVAPTALVRYKDILFAASRGSTNRSDFLCDANIQLKHVADGSCLPTPAEVHTGFFNAFDAQVSEVLDDIDKQIEAGVTKIVFCGHSLGGAVAQLLGLAYAHRRSCRPDADTLVNATVITFGCPRIGDETLCDHLKECQCHWRLFAHDDPVAGVPSPANRVLKASTSAQRYVEHASTNNWCLPADGCAQGSESTLPHVKRFVRDTLLHYTEHKVMTYAQRLNQHRGGCWTKDEAPPPAAGGAAQAPHDA